MTGAPRRSGEFQRIARYFAPLAAGEKAARGLRDDAAFLKVAAGRELVITTDALVAGVHFMADDPPGLIARKALRVNLSDLAAKGAVARWYFLAAAFPRGVGDDWIAAFARGLKRDQAHFGVRLLGGDTVATPGPASFTVTALGEAPAGRSPSRSGAKAGDDIFVTGTVGDAALGLLARGGALKLGRAHQAFLVRRYLLPEPRVTVGPRLIGLATATLDVSDGLLADIGHIAANSGLRAVIDETALPLSAATRAALARQPAFIERVLTGGDDYEIAFTARPEAAGCVAALARSSGVAITRIGRMARGRGVWVQDTAGRLRRPARSGWTHS